jgi:hypothetical protein
MCAGNRHEAEEEEACKQGDRFIAAIRTGSLKCFASSSDEHCLTTVNKCK